MGRSPAALRDPAAFEARLPDILRMTRAFREAFAELPDSAEKTQAMRDLEDAAPFVAAVAEAAGVTAQ